MGWPSVTTFVKVVWVPVVLLLMIAWGSGWAWKQPYFLVPAFLTFVMVCQRWQRMVPQASTNTGTDR